MVGKIPKSEQTGLLLADRRDRFALAAMCRENAQWLVGTHNGHVTAIQKVEPPLLLQAIPLWWLIYFEANDLRLNLG